ncbi:MAG: hypothetical protein ACOH12_00525 [Parvibaculaceae bacterium]
METGFQSNGVSYLPAWRLDSARYEADAIAMWSEMGALGAGVRPEERAKELAALAYRNGQLIGITTAVLHHYPPLRQRFAFMRMLLRPDAAQDGIDVPLAVEFRETLRQWSRDNPSELVAGCGAIVLAGTEKYAERPVLETGLALAGYTDEGHQVRVFWWDHFRIPV